MAAGKDDAKNTMRWIADEQTIHETAPYGENLLTVDDALSAQKHRVKMVQGYQQEIQKLSDDPQGKELNVSEAYDALKEVASKRLHCLEDIQQIAGLETLFGKLTSEFAEKATKLVETECERASATAEQQDSPEGVAKAAQNCILAVRANWCWISKLVRCADTHLKHVSDYHQFFHTAAEYDEWMPADLKKAAHKVTATEDMPNTKEEAEKLLTDLKEVLTMFLHWHGKLDTLFDQSRKVIPVHLRTKKLDYFRPVSALCDYKTKELVVREGEELTLTNNADSQSWQVRNMHNQETNVPSVILVIPGPDPAAIESAFKLRMELLGLWTLNIKRIGKSLIWFMVLCLKDWDEDEIKKLKAIPDEQKNDIRKCLTFIEESCLPNWADYLGCQEVQKRIQALREILDQKGDHKDYDEAFTNDLLARFGLIGELMKRYKDFWSFWDTFRIMCEACRSPEFLLIVERWQQLKYLDMDELRRRWHSGFGISSEDQDEFLAWLHRWLITRTTTVEEVIENAQTMTLGASQDEVEGMTDLSAKVETASTEQMTTAEQEERKTFVITGVIDPNTQKEIPMQEAVLKGIINSSTGTYVNTITGEQWPIPVAMNAGFIKVEFTSTKKTAEKRRDVGLITIRTQRESRPYTVKAVVDAQTERRLNVDEAIASGILDQTNGTYLNSVDNERMSLADAIDSNLLLVEYDKDAEVGEPEVVSKTFAIHSVVDQRAKKTVSFSQAIRKGLLDKETGAYYHNITGEYTYVGDAIKRGFIKATVVKDPNSLDIDPENKLVVEQIQNIRKKLLNPMKALATLRKAANAEEGK